MKNPTVVIAAIRTPAEQSERAWVLPLAQLAAEGRGASSWATQDGTQMPKNQQTTVAERIRWTSCSSVMSVLGVMREVENYIRCKTEVTGNGGRTLGCPTPSFGKN